MNDTTTPDDRPYTEIQGIDVSMWQAEVDFAEVAKAGFRFAYVKATEGERYKDKRFLRNWAKLRDLDGEIYRGAYHFCRPSSDGSPQDGEDEARDFCKALKDLGGLEGMLPPAIDFEEYSDNGPRENVPWIQRFVEVVRSELGRDPIVYTGAFVWRWEVRDAAIDADEDKWMDLPLWVVRYTRNRSIDPLTRGGYRLPWKAWDIWQWSGGGDFAFHGPVPGVKGVVDVNRFAGDEDDLARLCGLEPVTRFDGFGESPVQQVEAGAVRDVTVVERLRAMEEFHASELLRSRLTLDSLGEKPKALQICPRGV